MIFKIILLGDVKVGKSTIRLRYLGEGFRARYIATLGSDFSIKQVGTSQLQIWDLAGQSNFKPIIKNYYTGAHGIILVYDFNKEETMRNIPSWIDDFISAGNDIVPMVVIANKIDLRSDKNWGVDTEIAKKFVDDLSKHYGEPITYIETSALTGENISNAFDKLLIHLNDLIRQLDV